MPWHFVREFWKVHAKFLSKEHRALSAQLLNSNCTIGFKTPAVEAAQWEVCMPQRLPHHWYVPDMGCHVPSQQACIASPSFNTATRDETASSPSWQPLRTPEPHCPTSRQVFIFEVIVPSRFPSPFSPLRLLKAQRRSQAGGPHYF